MRVLCTPCQSRKQTRQKPRNLSTLTIRHLPTGFLQEPFWTYPYYTFRTRSELGTKVLMSASRGWEYQARLVKMDDREHVPEACTGNVLNPKMCNPDTMFMILRCGNLPGSRRFRFVGNFAQKVSWCGLCRWCRTILGASLQVSSSPQTASTTVTFCTLFSY